MTHDSVLDAIETLTARIRDYSARPGRVNESNTIRALVTPMLEALGWDVADLNEVQSEYRHQTGDNPVDYALFVDRTPSLFIEAKALDEKLDDRKWIVQTLNYANACNVAWAVLTNGAEWRVYNVHARAEAEDKLFYSVELSELPPEEAARRLRMLGKASMAPQRALDQVWRHATVDRAMRAVIEDLPNNRSAVRAMAKASGTLTEADVRESLRRIGLRADWPDDGDLFPAALGSASADQDAAASAADREQVDPKNASEPAPTPPADGSKRKRSPKRKPRMDDMIAAGLIKHGDTLRLRNHPNSDATVVDGKICRFQGEEMSYNAWGCSVTGWSAIQIYVQAETGSGDLLDDLRKSIT